MTARGEFTKVVSLRLSEENDKLLRSVAAQVPVIPKLTLARVAMLLGLQAIQRDPMRVLKSYGDVAWEKKRRK